MWIAFANVDKDMNWGGDVPLRFSLEEKDRNIENWIEFQAFHIRFGIEKLEKE
ncbi:hypothetical protein MMC18_005779, partial [Xylographa bjoerkii]|nr:hypothetical protein [Xylographa bjoerkii]